MLYKTAPFQPEARMSDPQGQFVWYELLTADTEAAKSFYGDVVGWSAQDVPMPGMTYTLFMLGDTHVCGLMNLPEDARRMGVPPNWIGYVAVDDVDASAEQAKRLGGAIHMQPHDIPNVGRFSVIADPQGATLALFKSSRPGQDQPPEPMAPGRTGWHELLAVDWEEVFDFYSEMFGWQKAEAIPMGEMGTYQLFSAGGPPIGGMFNKPPLVPVPFWLYYFTVPDIDAAAARVTAGGGQIVMGPLEVPGGAWIVQGRDPQGAMFALVGQRS
jgi:predicted enzyme related to lactoylglutathione lyase